MNSYAVCDLSADYDGPTFDVVRKAADGTLAYSDEMFESRDDAEAAIEAFAAAPDRFEWHPMTDDAQKARGL